MPGPPPGGGISGTVTLMEPQPGDFGGLVNIKIEASLTFPQTGQYRTEFGWRVRGLDCGWCRWTVPLHEGSVHQITQPNTSVVEEHTFVWDTLFHHNEEVQFEQLEVWVRNACTGEVLAQIRGDDVSDIHVLNLQMTNVEPTPGDTASTSYLLIASDPTQSQTQIQYILADKTGRPATVQIYICDLSGQVIRHLYTQPGVSRDPWQPPDPDSPPPPPYTVTWGGVGGLEGNDPDLPPQDDQGQPVRPGLYPVVIQARHLQDRTVGYAGAEVFLAPAYLYDDELKVPPAEIPPPTLQGALPAGLSVSRTLTLSVEAVAPGVVRPTDPTTRLAVTYWLGEAIHDGAHQVVIEAYNPDFQPLPCTPVLAPLTTKGRHTAFVDVALPDMPGPYTVLVRGLDVNGVTNKEKLLRDKWARVAGAVVYVPLRVENCTPQFVLYDPNSTDPDLQNPVLEFDVVTHPNTAPVDVEIYVYDAVTHDQVGYRRYEDVNIGLTAPGNHHGHAWNVIFAGQTLPPKGVYVYNVVAYKR